MGRISLRNTTYNLRRGWLLYVFLIPPLAYLIIFRYLPMYGIVIAFQDFIPNPQYGFFGDSPFVGFDNFVEIFSTDDFPNALRNTLVLNVLDLLFSFPAPIILALLLNELRVRWFKRVSQTLLYLPYFLSWAIIGGIVYQVFSIQHGVLNTAIKSLGLPAVPFLMEPVPWIGTYLAVGIWQSAGWGTILYLAAIAGINMELYDAAKVDGAGRVRSMWHITLPGIRPTIAILLILSIGRVTTIPFDRPYILGNILVRDVADVISTYVYRVGIQVGRYSIAAAVGLFQSLVGMILVFISNFLTKKFWGQGIW